jgi:hypothetical protein
MARAVNPEEVAVSYLRHEFRKIFQDIKDESFWRAFEHSMEGLPGRLGEVDFWQLLSGISEGMKIKWPYRILTNDSFSWTEEDVPIKQIKLTGMSPEMDDLIKDRANGDTEHFAKLYRKDRAFRQELHKVFQALSEPRNRIREEDPVLIREVKDGGLAVFDGMRRVLLAIVQGKKSVRAYVGRITKIDGKMRVNPDKVYFLTLLYQDSENKGALKPYLVGIAHEIIKQTRNGRNVWKERIGGWVRDDEVQELVRDILDEGDTKQ